MTEHQKDTAFLRRAIRFDDTEDGCALEEKIIQVQQDTRCIKRAIVLMILTGALAAAVFAYGMILGNNFPYGEHRTIVRIISVLGLTSLISLGAFSVLLLAYRLKLDGLRDDCRRRVTILLERHAIHKEPGDARWLRTNQEASPESDESLQWARQSRIPLRS